MKPASLLLAILLTISTANLFSETYQTINAEQSDSVIKSHFANPDFYIIDVRTASEYSSGHLYNSINIDYFSSDFEAQIDQLDKEATYLIHCKSGGRSSKALLMMIEKEFNTVYELSGGYNNWSYETTTEEINTTFRFYDAENTYTLIENPDLTIMNISKKENADLFTIKSSNIFENTEEEYSEFINTLDKEKPVLIYSSSGFDLDSVFYNLYLDGFQEVYYYNENYQIWIDNGYEYEFEPIKDIVTEPTGMCLTECKLSYTNQTLHIHSELYTTVAVAGIKGTVLCKEEVISGEGKIAIPEGYNIIIVSITQNNSISTLKLCAK